MGADGSKEEEEEQDEKQQLRSVATASAIPVAEESNSATIISSCLVGLLTGVAVVLFNNAVRLTLLSLYLPPVFDYHFQTSSFLTYYINLCELMFKSILLCFDLIGQGARDT